MIIVPQLIRPVVKAARVHILPAASTCSSLLLQWASLTGPLAVSIQVVAVRVLVVAVLLEKRWLYRDERCMVLQRGFHYRSFHY